MAARTDDMKTGAVTDEFDHASESYDRLVGANPGYHRDLHVSAGRLRLPDQGRGLALLDLGCGTGASTAALAHAAPGATILGVDASQGMLDVAAGKAWSDGVSFRKARAEELTPEWVERHLGRPADAVFAAYLIRNVPDPDELLSVVGSVLRPGGRLAFHEYSVADSLSAQLTWSAVCWGVVIPAGRILTGRSDLFRYLWSSVQGFDGRERLLQRMRESGLDLVRSAPLPGWQYGITHTFVGRRPLEQDHGHLPEQPGSRA